MKSISIWAIKVSCPEMNMNTQVRYAKKYDIAITTMQKAHDDFVAHLKTRDDIDQSRITDEPLPRQQGIVDVLRGHPVEEWKVTYPVDAGIRDGEPAFIWRKAYFYIQQQEFELLQKSDDPNFELF